MKNTSACGDVNAERRDVQQQQVGGFVPRCAHAAAARVPRVSADAAGVVLILSRLLVHRCLGGRARARARVRSLEANARGHAATLGHLGTRERPERTGSRGAAGSSAPRKLVGVDAAMAVAVASVVVLAAFVVLSRGNRARGRLTGRRLLLLLRLVALLDGHERRVPRRDRVANAQAHDLALDVPRV